MFITLRLKGDFLKIDIKLLSLESVKWNGKNLSIKYKKNKCSKENL